MRFAITEDPSKPQDQQEQVAVITSLSGAKTLAIMVLEAVKSYEDEAKTTVQTPNMDEVLAALRRKGNNPT
jgi:hypothetical protein